MAATGKELIQKFNNSLGMRKLSEEERKYLLMNIEAGDEDIVREITAILEEEERDNAALARLAQAITDNVAHKTLHSKMMSNLHDQENEDREKEKQLLQQLIT